LDTGGPYQARPHTWRSRATARRAIVSGTSQRANQREAERWRYRRPRRNQRQLEPKVYPHIELSAAPSGFLMPVIRLCPGRLAGDRVCRRPLAPGSRHCDEHRPKHGTRRARGYSAEYDRNRPIVLSSADRCAECGLPATVTDPLTVDHRVPLADGGTNDLSNLRALHRSCNSRLGAQRGSRGGVALR
jgi:5-methylcytosine-specific restriction protein A